MNLAIRAAGAATNAATELIRGRFAIQNGRDIQNIQNRQANDLNMDISEGLDMSLNKSSFDQVSIQSRETMDDESFVKLVSRSAIDSLRNGGVPETRAIELHKQVQAGEYTPVSSRIAERLLGYRS